MELYRSLRNAVPGEKGSAAYGSTEDKDKGNGMPIIRKRSRAVFWKGGMMMDLEVEALYEKWRKSLMKICLLILFLILAAEIILFLEYKSAGEIENIAGYILIWIVLPSVLNFLGFGIGCYMICCQDMNLSIKNRVPVLILLWFCSIVLVFHGVFPFVVTVFMIPVMLTIIYSDHGFTRMVIICSSIMIGLGFLLAVFQGFYEHDYYIFNYTAAAIIFIAGCIEANGLMRYETDIKGILRKNISEKQLLQEKLRQDALTGLYTFAAFEEIMEKKAPEGGKPIVVVLMCFDYKGALLERSLLQDFAQMIKAKSGLHGFGAYCRHGEFAMAFPGSSRQHAQDTVDDIRRAVQKYSAAVGMDFDVVSFTACISEYEPEGGETVNEFLHRVDQSLRRAQGIGGGRDIVV